ncbi:MAG: hypothetical protein ABR555_03580 [Pyrinomonadaceae bacterium]
MAEERTLGLARAPESTEDVSKEDLQRRMDQARHSISNTVTEIKETVANQVQAVKDTLDWREQYRRRPAAWSLGALGVGFVAGYGIAAAIKGDGNGHAVEGHTFDLSSSTTRAYAAQPIIGEPASVRSPAEAKLDTFDETDEEEDAGPGIFERLTTTPAYDRVRHEVAGIGNNLLEELSKTAKSVVIPALIKSLKDFLGGRLPGAENKPASGTAQSGAGPSDRAGSSYQPVLDHNGT